MSAPAGRDRPSGTTARTVAQAKVNLFLRVLAREATATTSSRRCSAASSSEMTWSFERT